MTKPKLSKYEKKVIQEIKLWQEEKEGVHTKSINFLGTPVDWVVEKVVPNAVMKTVSKSTIGFLEGLKDLSKWTYSNSDIINKAKKEGIIIDHPTELSQYPLDKLDKISRSYFSSNKMIAALEGAGCGLGGLALIAADIPLLFTAAFRAVQQIGASYGFDVDDPELSPIVFSVFNAGSSLSAASKATALADMHIAAKALGKNWTYKKIAETTQSGMLIKILKERTKHLPKDIASNITKKKLAQAVPIVGAGIGAGFNYWFMSNTTTSAYMLFRDLYITRKYGEEDKPYTDATEVNYTAQCSAITKAGKQCKNKTQSIEGLCHVHNSR